MKPNGAPLLIVAGILCTSPWAAAGRTEPVMRVRMKDGSSLTAVIESKSIPLTSEYGKLAIPSGMLHSLRSDPESGPVQADITNGDRLSGWTAAASLRVRHALGVLSVPLGDVVELGGPVRTVSRREVTQRPVAMTPVRFEVTLRDGSCLLAEPQEEDVGFRTVFGQCRLPWVLVRRVEFHDDHETSTAVFWSGDSIVGCMDWSGCPVSTGVGPARISTATTTRVDVSLGGIDLVARSAPSASGTRHFMGAIRSTQPRRIGGRVRPATQFIEAHASGRIEYEFDEPVTEFRAIATMYESYCAHKGSVIFKVETEHGQVHATRALRNLEREDVYVRFAPTRKLVLVTDQNGSADEDWSVWLQPEVR